MQQIDLCETINKNFKMVNKTNNELGKVESLFRYFIKNNIINLFGKTTFDEDEIKVVGTKGGLVVDSIFGINLNISMGYDGSFSSWAIDTKSKKECFRIFMNDKMAINECYVGDKSCRYEVNIEDDTFSYITLDDNKDVDFAGCLVPLGSKRSEFEIFEIRRMVPHEVEPKTLMEKIKKTIKGDNFIRIETGYSLDDFEHYIDVIYERLKLEANLGKETTKTLKNQGN